MTPETSSDVAQRFAVAVLYQALVEESPDFLLGRMGAGQRRWNTGSAVTGDVLVEQWSKPLFVDDYSNSNEI